MTLSWIEQLGADLRYGIRMLRRNPGFTAVAVLSLALGIGANTAVFSVLDPLLVRSLPVPDPEQLVLFERVSAEGEIGASVSYPMFRGIRDRNRAFSGIFVSMGAQGANVVIQGSAGERFSIRYDLVSGGFFSTLGVEAAYGRTFTESDEAPDQPRVAVLSDRYWKTRFGGNPNVIGQTLTFSNGPAIIIGVMPQGFSGFEVGFAPDLWMPLRVTSGSSLNNMGSQVLRMMARLRSEVTPEQAASEVDGVYSELIEEALPVMQSQFGPQVPADQRNAIIARLRATRLLVQPGGTGWTPLRDEFGKALWILMAAVATVLLIACSNVASLLLSRGTDRHKEIAVRLAIGGGRARLIRQLLTESILLAGIGSTAGLALAYWGVQLILAYVSADVASALYTGPDRRILFFTVAISLLSALACGLVPAIRSTRVNLAPDLKETAHSATRSRVSMSRSLVVSQVALSMILLTGTGLFVRTLLNLRSLDPGFDKQNSYFFTISPRPGAAPPDPVAWMNHFKEIRPALESLQGVQAASVSLRIGLLAGSSAGRTIEVEGYTPRPGEDMEVALIYGGARYFESLGTSVILGRDFLPSDETEHSRVAVINQTMANRFFGEQNPIGKHFGSGPEDRAEIVGVVKDAKYSSLRETSHPAFYLPLSYSRELWGFGPRFLLKASTTTGLDAAIRSRLRDIDPDIVAAPLQPMGEVVESTIVKERLIVRLAGVLSLIALVLACVGLYGTLSCSVAQRTHEIGIRMALGARIGNVVGMWLRETAVLLGIGVSLGIAGAVLGTRPLAPLLFELSPADPLTLFGSASLLITAAVIAAYLPARRASRVDPLIALRHE